LATCPITQMQRAPVTIYRFASQLSSAHKIQIHTLSSKCYELYHSCLCLRFSIPAFFAPAISMSRVNVNQNAVKHVSKEHSRQFSGQLETRWRPMDELAAMLMPSASADVAAARESLSMVIDRGPVDSKMLPSAFMSCDSDPMSSSCHPANT